MKAKIIQIKKHTGLFAENKDIARDIRNNLIMPALEAGSEVILDFVDMTGATQSFIHALISQLIRKYNDDVFTKIFFKNCNDEVKGVINIVADYMEAS